MKVALVILPVYSKESPSLAIAYLASHLIKAGHTVSRFEFNLRFTNNKWINYMENINNDNNLINKVLYDPSKLKKEKFSKLDAYIKYCALSIIKEKPKVVGFSVYTPNKNLSLLVAKKIKELSKDITIVFGGPHSFFNEKRTEFDLKTRWVDYVIFGEGERALPKLLKNLDNPENISISGVGFLRDTKIIHKDWVPEKDINTFEFPLFQKDDIKNSGIPWRIPIITSRGCIYNCNFCAQGKLWKGFRQRTPENVLDEIKFQIKRLGVTNFRFNDSLLNININFIKEFCELIIKEGVSISWGGNVKVDKSLDNSILSLMYKAGCRFLYFGAESGSNKVLNDMNKEITSELIEQNIKDAHRNKIWVHPYFIVGYPTETEEDFNKTVQFIISNRDYIDSFMVNAFNLNNKADIYKKSAQFVNSTIRNKRLEEIERIFEYKTGYYKKSLRGKIQVRFQKKTPKAFTKDLINNFSGQQSNLHPDKEKHSYQKFVIISAARSGSWYLSSLLASHSQIICFGELFQEDSIVFSYPGYKPSENILQLRKKDPGKFVDKVIFTAYPKNISSVGFKYLYYQMKLKDFQSVNPYLKNISDLKIIHLKRKNYLKCLVSYKIAKATNQWRAWTDKDVDKSKKVMVQLDYETCLNFFKERDKEEKKCDDYFRNHQKIDVIYEDLVRYQTKEANNIQKFLRVKQEILSSPYKKQDKRPLSKVISNYWKLKEKFKNTPWTAFFED